MTRWLITGAGGQLGTDLQGVPDGSHLVAGIAVEHALQVRAELATGPGDQPAGHWPRAA